jgi:hypothetical protein
MKALRLITGKLPDLSGICFSFLCVIHCMATPLAGTLLVVYPNQHHDHYFHLVILGAGIGLSFLSLRNNSNMKFKPAIIVSFICGWLLFILCEYTQLYGMILVRIISGLLIASGHILNMLGKGFHKH